MPPLGQISPSQTVQDYTTLPSPRESSLWSLLFPPVLPSHISLSSVFSLSKGTDCSLCILRTRTHLPPMEVPFGFP